MLVTALQALDAQRFADIERERMLVDLIGQALELSRCDATQMRDVRAAAAEVLRVSAGGPHGPQWAGALWSARGALHEFAMWRLGLAQAAVEARSA